MISILPHLPPNYKCLFWKCSDIRATFESFCSKKKTKKRCPQMVLEDFIVLDEWKEFHCQVIYVFKDDSQRALRPCIPKQKHVHFENLGMRLNQLCFFIKTIQIVLDFAQKAKSHVTCESLIDWFFFFFRVYSSQTAQIPYCTLAQRVCVRVCVQFSFSFNISLTRDSSQLSTKTKRD